MEYTYTVEYNGKTVGDITIYPMGLFVRIVCKCYLQTKGRYLLFCESQAGRQRLGLLIPEGYTYTYCAQMPKNRLCKEPIRFRLYQSDVNILVVGSPVEDIAVLTSARLRNIGDGWVLERI